MRSRHSAFTLIELLIVILVVLLITAVTMPSIRSALEGRKVREAARLVEVFLNGARNRAIASGHSVGVLIEPDKDEPSRCIALSYAEQPDPYAGDYENSTMTILGNGGFGAWQTIAWPSHGIPATTANDSVFPMGDVGWLQNVAPGDLMTLGTDDVVQYRIHLGEPYIDVNSNGIFDSGEPFNDVDGSGAASGGMPPGVGYTPPNLSYIDPMTGFFSSMPQQATWGTQSAFVTYAYADPVVALNYMSPTGLDMNPLTGIYDLPIYLGFHVRIISTTSVFRPTHLSLDAFNANLPDQTYAFVINRRPVKSSSAVVNMPDSTCIDLGSSYADQTTGNIIAVPGSGFDMLVPFSAGDPNGKTLGNYAAFRPNPLTDHEIIGNAAAASLINRPLMITFDPSGVVDRVYSFDERHFIKDTNPASLSSSVNFTDYQGRLATGQIYLLIGRTDLIDGDSELLATFKAGNATLKPVFNMQDPSSLWVAINPRTGLISSTENVAPDLTKAPPTMQTMASPQVQLHLNAQTYQARTLAREALDMGGM